MPLVHPTTHIYHPSCQWSETHQHVFGGVHLPFEGGAVEGQVVEELVGQVQFAPHLAQLWGCLVGWVS